MTVRYRVAEDPALGAPVLGNPGSVVPLMTTSTTSLITAIPLGDALRSAARKLAAAGVPDPTVDAELLLAHLRGTSRGEVQAAGIRGDILEIPQAEAYHRLISRRATREPLQHITGVAAFRSLELSVGPGVFVPRPETEMVAGLAIDALRAAGPAPVAVDLCTGSGAIALAMATEVPAARVHAVEQSIEAYMWAKENVARTGAENLSLVLGDAGEAETLAALVGTVDVVATNPPYVPDDAIPRDEEVRLHDPAQALYGGPDGLDVVRRLSIAALALARSGGTIVIEHGEWQGEPIRELLSADGWLDAATFPDLTGRDRATTAVRP